MKNNCKDCNYKEHALSGHCYMFKHEPRGICGQFRAKPGAGSYRPTVSDDSPMCVKSVINSNNYYETNDSSSSYSGGGGESGGGESGGGGGGGGASGDY